MRVFVTGGTGQVGSRLIDRLLARGDQPIVLTRRPEAARSRWGDRCGVAAGDPTQVGDWTGTLKECDAVVHLAGENLMAHRWSAAFKERLRTSRILGTANVAKALSANPRRGDGSPRVLVSASAIGFYGPHGDEDLDETAPPGGDFLAQMCIDWEQATQPAIDAGVRVAKIRTGIVLDAAGGPLRKMLLPFRLFVGGPIGSGRQYMSWIHHADETGIILAALDHPQAQGPINATAPEPLTNREFSRVLGRVLHRPSFMPTPAIMIRMAIGQAAVVVTTGQRVRPRRALELGYVFQFPQLEGALRDLLGKNG
jgi:uncharacterized protein (TIGR01777 family)